jgi:hypothetical protein
MNRPGPARLRLDARRIPPARVGELRVRSPGQVNAQHVGQQDEVQQHVRELLASPSVQRLARRQLAGTVSGQPLEQLGQLANLAHQGEEHRLRIVVAAPLAVCGELAHAIAQRMKIRHAASMTRASGVVGRRDITCW